MLADQPDQIDGFAHAVNIGMSGENAHACCVPKRITEPDVLHRVSQTGHWNWPTVRGASLNYGRSIHGQCDRRFDD